jgi:hypothetical protein
MFNSSKGRAGRFAHQPAAAANISYRLQSATKGQSGQNALKMVRGRSYSAGRVWMNMVTRWKSAESLPSAGREKSSVTAEAATLVLSPLSASSRTGAPDGGAERRCPGTKPQTPPWHSSSSGRSGSEAELPPAIATEINTFPVSLLLAPS